MGIFDLFDSKSEPDPDAPHITVIPNRDDAAVYAGIDWRDATPGDETQIVGRTYARLSLLNLLARAELAEKRSNYSYTIPFASIPQLDSFSSGLLGLEPQHGWKAKVRVGGIIGRGDPELYLVFTDPEGNYDPVGRDLVVPVECGFWSLVDDELAVLPNELLELRERIERGPEDLNGEQLAAEYRYVAQVKDLALKARRTLGEDVVELAGQLEQEEFVAADAVEAHVENAENGGLELYPAVDGLEDEQSRRKLLEANEHKELFTRRDETRTTRIALSPQCRREVHRVRKRHRIPPEDVRDFVRDPRSYIQPPEELAADRQEIAKTRGIPIEEVEESPDFNPDKALDLKPVEEVLKDFNVRLYGDRVIGVEVDAPAIPNTDTARTTDLGNWSGEKGESQPKRDSNEDASGSKPVDEAVETGDVATAVEAPDSRKQHPTKTTSKTKVEPADDAASATSEDHPAASAGKARLVTIDNDKRPEFVIESEQRRQRLFEDFGKPKLFDGTLRRPYQTEGYVWLRELEDRADAGGLLADDMGMGKTVQIIALLSYLADERALSPALLVIPKSTLQNWQNEIADFCSADLGCYEHLGGSRHRNADAIIDHDIVLTTYSTLRNDQLILGEIRFSVMICDEAQKIKNYTSGRATACRAMNAGLRVALTATPVENGLVDLWSIFDFCQPGRLDSMAAFKKDFVEPIETGDEPAQQQASENLLRQMAPHFLRRTKTQHFDDTFPDKFVHRTTVSMTDAQQHRYDRVRKWYSTEEGSALGAINTLLRICAHPDAVTVDTAKKIGLQPRPIDDLLDNPDDIIDRSAKFEFIVQKLKEIQDLDERTILFVRQRNIQAMLQAVISHVFGLDAALINGDIPAGRRQEIVDDLNNSRNFDVIILSPRAAGVGINVTGANHVFHVTREWNPAVEDQATDRAYRIGQSKDVHVYLPITTHPSPEVPTLDERLDKLLEAKRKIAENAIVPRNPGPVSSSELQNGLT